MEKFDTIIVGGGLAGCILALQLIENGKKVLLVDNQPEISSSKLAAGKFNPIVFKRLNKSWEADKLVPYLNQFYLEAEQKLKASFFFPSDNMVKLFPTEEHKKQWEERREEEDFDQYLGFPDLELPNWVNDACSGYSRVLQSGWLNVSDFVSATHHFLQEDKESDIMITKFDFENLCLENDTVKYDSVESDKIIFSEGYHVKDNPYFSYLPFSLTKGEILTVKASSLNLNNIISKGFFVQPLKGDEYKIGATFNWEDKTEIPTPEAKEQLKAKFENLYQGEYKVVNQVAGIRPTIVDRRPTLGVHPKHSQVYIFNGLGTKGVMIAPYYSSHFYNYLYNGTPLNKEVDIQRFEKKHFHS